MLRPHPSLHSLFPVEIGEKLWYTGLKTAGGGGFSAIFAPGCKAEGEGQWNGQEKENGWV